MNVLLSPRKDGPKGTGCVDGNALRQSKMDILCIRNITYSINVSKRNYVIASMSLTTIFSTVPPTAGLLRVIRAWAASKPVARTAELQAKPGGREPGLRRDDAGYPPTFGASGAHWLFIRAGKF